jgi:hypothetical protein
MFGGKWIMGLNHEKAGRRTMIHRDDLIAIAVVLPTAFLTVWGLMDILNRIGFFRIFWGIP